MGPARWAISAVSVPAQALWIGGQHFWSHHSVRTQIMNLGVTFGFRQKFTIEGGSDVREETAEVHLVELEADEDRVEIADEWIQSPQQRREFVAEELAQSGEAGGGSLDHRSEALEEGLRF